MDGSPVKRPDRNPDAPAGQPEQIEMEIERLRREHRELKAFVRMQSHLQFHAAHELRTPLAAVRGYARMMLDGKGGEINTTQRDYLTAVVDNSNRLINLVSWMSRVAEQSPQELRLTTFDLRDVWIECVAARQSALGEKSITLTQQIPHESFVIMADREKLAEVFTKLLAIATEFTRRGGAITAEFSRGREREIIVKISDNGVGIPMEMLNKRLDRSLSTGELSLSGIYDAIGMHGGRVFVNSKPEQGSSVLFTLPAVMTDGKEESGHEQAVHSSRRR